MLSIQDILFEVVVRRTIIKLPKTNIQRKTSKEITVSGYEDRPYY
jgi:hypothetical protein